MLVEIEEAVLLNLETISVLGAVTVFFQCRQPKDFLLKS